jgi:DNA invertase Pin-like site-specific DNA recombinase
MKAVAYLRVSTEDQATRGVSLEAQRAKVEAYVGLYDLELAAVVEDAGVSARTMDRPGLQRALTMLARGEAQALIVLKLDRLTRSVRDLGELLEGPFAKAALLSVGEQIDTRTAAGRLVLNVLASVAQWEREAIGERTATAMAHKKTKGERVGAVPYGYGLDADGHALVPVAAEQAVIAEARRLKASGLALRAIAAELERAGMVARSGKRFEAAQVQRMVAA